MERKISEDKKAISEMVSYVLLIVIALGIAAGVYAWLRFYVPSGGGAEECSEDIAISINDYNCSAGNLSLDLENKGLFNINGFFIRAANESGKLPTIMLNTTDALPVKYPGRYDFATSFKPGKIAVANFNYTGFSIKRIQVQPFVVGEKTKTAILCENIADINLDC